MKKLILLFFAAILTLNISAQETETMESLKAMKAEKAAAAAALQAEADALQARIDVFPGWKVGGAGIIGLNLAGNNGWYAVPEAFSSNQNLGLDFTAFANHDAKKTFWRNQLTIGLSRLASKQFAALDSSTVAITDNLQIASLAGYKLTEKIAISAEGLYNSTVLNFNDPGQLILSAGITWTPITDLVVIIHPIGYQLNFPSATFSSSPGAKIGVRYNKELIPGITWITDLNAFVSYGEGDNNNVVPVGTYSAADMSNWTWNNKFAFNAFKGIGFGVGFSLRGNQQLDDVYRFNNTGYVDPDFDSGSTQFTWNAGLSYGF